MRDAQGEGSGGSAAEELVLRTVAAHADSLLRTARRFSLCPDDAQDAYQRALEIFMRHADRLDPPRAAGWLHVVVKREAQAIRRSRQRIVASHDVDLDAHEARSVPSPEEQLATFDLIGRSAEALQRLKPQELRALWLRAQGHSYSEIGAITGWSYTKVNRCLTEGRRSFLSRYADIESGAECEAWQPVISAMVDGEATSAQLIDLRPHLRNCPGCRATLKALRDSSQPLAAILPIPLATVTMDGAERMSSLLTRLYEMLAGGLHDRAATSMMKVQAVAETTAAGKAAAIAGAAAAVAGGGYATVDRTMVERPVERPRAVQKSSRAVNILPAVTPRIRQPAPLASTVRGKKKTSVVTEFASKDERDQAPEFARSQTTARAASANSSDVRRIAVDPALRMPRRRTVAAQRKPASDRAAPEFTTIQPAAEFGP